MPAMSNFLENKIMDHILANGREQIYTPPETLHIALFTSDAGLENNTEGEQTEVSGGAYARILLDGAVNYFTAAANGSASNHADIEFATATASWGTVTHAAIMDAAASGNVLFWGPLIVPKSVASGDLFKITAGSLTLSID
ncbi:MAG: hypothetical protein PWQ57_3311 [Desulfovibrionales bacterium]|nr:hypothetical protein [Desulfovibrionales bacterium]